MTTGPEKPNQQGMPNLPNLQDSGLRNAPDGRTHSVQPSENLAQIAERYGVDIPTITSANGLSEHSLIYPGLKLLIPSAGANEQRIEALPESHLVKPGESLFSIAQIYGFTVAKLQQLNSLSDNVSGYKFELG